MERPLIKVNKISFQIEGSLPPNGRTLIVNVLSNDAIQIAAKNLNKDGRLRQILLPPQRKMIFIEFIHHLLFISKKKNNNEETSNQSPHPLHHTQTRQQKHKHTHLQTTSQVQKSTPWNRSHVTSKHITNICQKR